MREKLNSNPMLQAAVVGVLLLGSVFFLISSTGGGEEEPAVTEPTISVTEAPEAEAGLSAAPAELPAGAPLDAPPLPRAVSRAYEANQTLVLLFVRNSGIDDRLVAAASAGLGGLRDVALFVVPASRISRYASITEGVGVERVPALVVVSPKQLEKTVPTASVNYGFQSPQSIVQAVIDAGYQGPTVDYHP